MAIIKQQIRCNDAVHLSKLHTEPPRQQGDQSQRVFRRRAFLIVVEKQLQPRGIGFESRRQ
ncbi:hypothetical protein MXD81_30765 [Microbacteriaceae bacterium K1510]|nr:hypothetical protein [Microbacteriaceae bacterium K1510]